MTHFKATLCYGRVHSNGWNFGTISLRGASFALATLVRLAILLLPVCSRPRHVQPHFKEACVRASCPLRICTTAMARRKLMHLFVPIHTGLSVFQASYKHSITNELVNKCSKVGINKHKWGGGSVVLLKIGEKTKEV